MSSAVALALVTTSAFFGLAAHLKVVQLANQLAGEVASGIVDGAPIPREFRLIILYLKWTFLPPAGAAAGFAVAAINITIALHVTDDSVAWLSYLFVLMGSCVAVGWLVGGLLEFIYLRTLLREAPRESP